MPPRNVGMDQGRCRIRRAWASPARVALLILGVATAASGTCVDSDNGATDTADDGCTDYYSYPSWCGPTYDDDDFSADVMCCAGGGGDAGTTPTPTQSGVFATTGSCVTSGDCVSSPNYPSSYGNDESCTITPQGSGKLSVTSFSTESYYDHLTIDGVAFRL